ncbi:MAG TPA: DUF814 domain-containing protein [Deltaproteobacteria bacterium]|nr:DUF814 domain-containing protein [Deltaproteobacteria bacterium]
MFKSIALLSGGLDSMLAAKLVSNLGIDVICLAFTTPFFDSGKAKMGAKQINLPLLIEDITQEHLQMLKAPRYGYGKYMNPCIDCHTLMLKNAGKKMEALGADFIITGEVLGQRPMSQTKQSLHIVAKNSGYAEYILRPLSAKLLNPIKAESEGIIDRSKLLGISGRRRKDQMLLAEELGIVKYPPPAGGCLLTDPMFSRRLRDLFAHNEDRQIRDFELLKYGRHFRLEDNTKIIVGRNVKDNMKLHNLTCDDDMTLTMSEFPGPYVIIPYGKEEATRRAAALCVRYSDAPPDTECIVICRRGQMSFTITAKAASREDFELFLI